jgi:glycogen operon protein
LAFSIPPGPQGRRWRRVVDTAKPSPDDVVADEQGPVIAVGATYAVAPFSLVVLISEG